MATGDGFKNADGLAVNVDLLHTVGADQLAVVNGWLGFMAQSGDSGDSRAMRLEEAEYQLTIPGALSVAKGDIIYIEVDDVTGHIPDSTAYSTSAGSGKQALGRATSAHYTGADGSSRVVDIIYFRNTIAAS
jgi:hypothetical protein